MLDLTGKELQREFCARTKSLLHSGSAALRLPLTGILCVETGTLPEDQPCYCSRQDRNGCNKLVFLHLEMLVLATCLIASYLGSVQCPPGKYEKVPPERTTLTLLSSIMTCVLCGLTGRDDGVWAAFLTVSAGSGSQQLHHIHANRPCLKPILRTFFWRYRNWSSSSNAAHEMGRYFFRAT